MDPLRAVQLLTDVAYFLLGIAAAVSAVGSRERARSDVALLFGTLAAVVILQEIEVLSCASSTGCFSVPGAAQLTVVVVLLLPFFLLRLVDDVSDVPTWQMWLALVVVLPLGLAFVVAGDQPPGWLTLAIGMYVTLGTVYAAWAFVLRARSTRGITGRRMAAVAWGCGLLAATFCLALLGFLSPVLLVVSRCTALISGLFFWAGFFPPPWLSQAWRLPELLEYLRPTRLIAGAEGSDGLATDAFALEQLTAATARTTGARRALLVLEDESQGDLYLWGAPSARVDRDAGLIGQVLRSGEPLVVRPVSQDRLPPAVAAVFATETLPGTAMLVPVSLHGRVTGVLAAFADKGPMFVEDDLEVVRFFAGEAAAILQMRSFRESASELEALREADRLKDEFMAVVSHELRTPLTAISGYADILLRKLSGPLTERQERQVLGIRDAARRLLALINDLLDVSKLEAGTLDLHLGAVEVEGAIARAVAQTRVIAAAKGVLLDVLDPPQPLPAVRADDERLQQILTNLLMNAIKFTPQGGSVHIGARAEPSTREPGATDIVFSVEDTGVGLEPEHLQRVWERFYQAESSSTRRFGGAGLGLSIVRRLAELHGGHAEVASAGANLGSTFSVHIPADTGAPAGASAPPPSRAPLQGVAAVAASGVGTEAVAVRSDALVLVVEDDLHIATVLRTYLETAGYRVEVVGDGQLALQAARSLSPFAITLDISLPKLDGWSVLNALKREPATAQIPVIIVSIVDNRDFGMLLGATDYLVKPIDHERLQAVLRSLRQLRGHTDGAILVVDDDAALRDVLSSLLAEDGWRVTTAGDGEAALAVLERERPAAMVLDLMMPRLDGFEVLEAVRERPATRDLPVIIVTAKDLTEEDTRRLSAGAQRVILKQALNAEDLGEQMRELLHQFRARGDGNGHL